MKDFLYNCLKHKKLTRCHWNTRLFHQLAIPITGVLITHTWPSFTNHQHPSIRARRTHKHIVWSPLWKRTQLVRQATYLNSCSKFPDLLRLLLVFLCVYYYYLPASDSWYQLLETHYRHATISLNLVTENISSILFIPVKDSISAVTHLLPLFTYIYTINPSVWF